MRPLTHHELLRLAAPLVRRGLSVDLAASDRASRRVMFAPTAFETPAGRVGRIVWSAEAIEDGAVEVVRAAALDDGRVATFAARAASADEVDGALGASDAVPATHQFPEAGSDLAPERGAIARAALDHALVPAVEDPDPRRGPVGTRLALRSATVLAGPLSLAVDASTWSAMPADVRLSHARAGVALARDTLASGARLPAREPAARAAARALGRARRDAPREATSDDARALLDAVPDDLLAVAGGGWRVLRGVGDRRRAALAGLGGGARRSERLEAALGALLPALADYVADPAAWHARHRATRRRVWFARLKPVLVLLAILATMPIAWLAVRHGGLELHPLALGLTPLMMVAIVTLSAREVPVTEIPPWPRTPPPLPGPAGADIPVRTAPDPC